jgi:YesN/AraC family two-component response regulator
VHRHAAFQTDQLGGKYMYLCKANNIFCMAQIIDDGNETDTAAEISITSNYKENSPNDEYKYLIAGPIINEESADRINDISNVLQAMANYISGYEYRKLISKQLTNEKQTQINDYIQSIKARMMLGINGFMPYPYDKEKKLTFAIMTGNFPEARMYLNEILGHIFFASADNLDAIKIRAMELTVMISRASLDGGADMNNVYLLNLEFITDFFKLETIEEVCMALTEILNRFSNETFKIEQVKHVELLSKAISYISTNYMHKISLDNVANYIYLSPSYLCKIFKEEMKTNFSNYLNRVRVEKSKILLLSEQLTITEIAILVGFCDQSYFNKVFKKQTGITPKKFREQSGNI